MASETSGSLATTGSVTLSKPPADTLANISISGTYGTVTFVIEGSIDGTNFFGLAAGDMVTGTTNITSTISPTDNATYGWRVPCEGCVKVRARATAVGTGTATFTINSGSFAGLPTSQATAGGTVAAAMTFNGGITMGDAQNIVVGSTTGTKIATATTQKLGFYNLAPIVQPTASTNATTGTTGASTGVSLDTTLTGGSGASAYTVGGVVLRLKQLGLLAT